MQAIIMAGGKGTRITEITADKIPKPLIPLHNTTLLDYLIHHTKKNRCDNVIICTGHLSREIEEHIKKNDYGITIRISKEYKPLGSAGPLHLIENILEDEFFVLSGDVYTTINLRKMFQFHKRKNADVTIATHVSDHPWDSTIVHLNKNSRIIRYIEKPGDAWKQYGNLTTTSLYIVKKSVLEFISPNKEVDLTKEVFPNMLKTKKKFFGYFTEEYAKDIGTPERYNKVLQLLKK
jgi:mannose-1-phosphate guanylyltransferase/phosphomannomutase